MGLDARSCTSTRTPIHHEPHLARPHLHLTFLLFLPTRHLLRDAPDHLVDADTDPDALHDSAMQGPNQQATTMQVAGVVSFYMSAALVVCPRFLHSIMLISLLIRVVVIDGLCVRSQALLAGH